MDKNLQSKQPTWENENTVMTPDGPVARKHITVEELDFAVNMLKELRHEYDQAKELSNRAHFKYKKHQELLIELLESSGKTKYHVDGVGLAYLVKKFKVSMPKDIAKKEELYKYIAKKGKEVLYAMTSINYNTLNSFYNAELEVELGKGNAGFQVPGMEAPIGETTLGFRKK